MATNGDHLALAEYDVYGTDGEVGEIEVKTLTVVEVDDDGRILRQVSFDADERDRPKQRCTALAAPHGPR